MSNRSKWAIYNSSIESLLTDANNRKLSYQDLAKKVLGPGWDYRDVDLLRTYIRRNYAHLKISSAKPTTKILIYDLETSLLEARVFWTGKQYIRHSNIKSEPQIITVSWKYLYEDKVHDLEWNQDTKSDEELVKEFIKVYNEADIVVGINNDSFDNKWINTRAAKYGLPINTKVKSFDLQKSARKNLRLISYSMKYMAQYFGLPLKYQHSGIGMWEHICFGQDPKEIRKAMDEMVHYNVQDIVTTEAIFHKLLPYLSLPYNLATLNGGDKWNSPFNGSRNVVHHKVTSTSAGTLQHTMRCLDTGGYYKISNTDFLKYVEQKDEEYV